MKWSLPDAHTDFIIAVAAEEYGLILVLFILFLFSLIVVRSLLRLTAERDPFARLAGTGLACIFGVQAMINMGVAVAVEVGASVGVAVAVGSAVGVAVGNAPPTSTAPMSQAVPPGREWLCWSS